MTKKLANNSQGKIYNISKAPTCDHFSINNYFGAIYYFIGQLANDWGMSSGSLLLYLPDKAWAST